MDFALSPDQELLRSAARGFLDERVTPAVVRALWEDARGESDAIWKEMAGLGWLGLGLPEAWGGSGLGMVEAAVLLEELGRVAWPGPYLETALGARALAEAGSEEQRRRWLPALAAGDARATVCFLDDGLDWNPEAATTKAEPASGRFGRAAAEAGSYRLSGTKRFVGWAQGADVLLIPAREAAGLSLFLVERRSADLRIRPAASMDPGTRWATVELDGVPVGPEARVGPPGGAAPILAALLRAGAVGAAAGMLGCARRCLDQSVAYAKVREQFGQPVGSFQAVRHKCAEMLLLVENAHAATYYAAWALDAGAEDGEIAASVAKSYVGDAARQVCGDAIQVHGGIGFTWEFDLHLYVKRAKALEASYGDGDYHREEIARRVTA
jgi:alkylation response protein AidB-like acyl-CoA dehydrogenase